MLCLSGSVLGSGLMLMCCRRCRRVGVLDGAIGVVVIPVIWGTCVMIFSCTYSSLSFCLYCVGCVLC